MSQIRYGAPISAEVAARCLPTTFEQVANYHTLRQPVPVIPAPAQLVDHRRQEERSIGNAPRQHDMRTSSQRLHKRSRPQVGAGKN